MAAPPWQGNDDGAASTRDQLAFARSPAALQQQPQHMGMPPSIMQHVQPSFMQAHMQSQHAWIMSHMALSPLVHVMQTPSLVIMHSHLHMAMLHWHITMPFIMQQRLIMPPAIILHMFCSVAAAISSSQVQVSFMPPLHFSIFIVQRGTMAMPRLGIMLGIPDIWPIEGIPLDMPAAPIIMPRSIIIALDIASSSLSRAPNGPQRQQAAD
jgi:hypothetical protein